MNNISIKKVETKRELDDFVTFADRLYADCPYYVPDLHVDIRETFDPRKNPGLEFSDIQPFIAYDKGGNVVGRIAGIINRRANEKWHTRNVRFGFIEFVDDPEERVARAAEGKPAVIPDWDGPLFCYASDRVAQDGCKVQLMDRLLPEREDMGWESGWA